MLVLVWLELLAPQPLHHVFRIERIGGDAKQRGDNNQFLIGDISHPGFNLPQCRTADVQACQLAAGGKRLLRQP